MIKIIKVIDAWESEFPGGKFGFACHYQIGEKISKEYFIESKCDDQKGEVEFCAMDYKIIINRYTRNDFNVKKIDAGDFWTMIGGNEWTEFSNQLEEDIFEIVRKYVLVNERIDSYFKHTKGYICKPYKRETILLKKNAELQVNTYSDAAYLISFINKFDSNCPNCLDFVSESGIRCRLQKDNQNNLDIYFDGNIFNRLYIGDKDFYFQAIWFIMHQKESINKSGKLIF